MFQNMSKTQALSLFFLRLPQKDKVKNAGTASKSIAIGAKCCYVS